MIVTHKLLDCKKVIVTHKLLDCNEMIVTHKLLDFNEMIVFHKYWIVAKNRKSCEKAKATNLVWGGLGCLEKNMAPAFTVCWDSLCFLAYSSLFKVAIMATWPQENPKCIGAR